MYTTLTREISVEMNLLDTVKPILSNRSTYKAWKIRYTSAFDICWNVEVWNRFECTIGLIIFY